MDFRNGDELHSKVHQPALGFISLVGSAFVITGVAGFLLFGSAANSDMPEWFAKPFFGVFALFGAFPLLFAVRSICWPVHVRHAAFDVLPDVPSEPLIRERSVVHDRLKHELCESNGGWEFRPAESAWLNDKRFLIGFGVPFLVLASVLLTWILHEQQKIASWPLSAALAVCMTAMSGGICLALVSMGLREGYSALSQLTIPADGTD